MVAHMISADVGDRPTVKERPSMLMPAIASAGIATAVIGATMPGWDGSTWWGVIGDPIGTSAPHVPFMVSLAPLIVVVVNVVVPLRAPSMRPWFGPAVATSSLLMLGQIFAWTMLYRSLTDARPPSGGSLVMLVGLVLALGASLADWGSWQRYLGARRSPSARRWPAVVALGGIALTVLGAGLPLWSRSNPWGPPRPPIPSGVNPGREPGAALTWWEVLGPDPRNLVMEAELAVALIPAAIAVTLAVVLLIIRPWRRWLGPAVSAATTMWFVWLVAWWGIYEDHVDSVAWLEGFDLMFLGLVAATGAALADGREQLSEVEWRSELT